MQPHVVRFVGFSVVALAFSCATTKEARTSSEPDLVIDVASENVRIGDQMFPTADDTALRAAINGACADGCGVVEVRPTPSAPFVALHAVGIGIAQTDVERAQMQFVEGTTVPLARDPQTTEAESCPAQVVGLEDRMYVYLRGQVLPPTKGCDDWGATVCGDADAPAARRYDWKELRRRVRKHRAAFATRVCVNLDSRVPAEVLERITSVVEEAEPAEGFILRTGKRGGELPPDEIENVIMARQVAIQTCYEDALTASKSAGAMQFTLRMVIGPAGRVDRAGIVDARSVTEPMKSCILDLARGLEFPAPSEGGNVVVNYPLSFTPAR